MAVRQAKGTDGLVNPVEGRARAVSEQVVRQSRHHGGYKGQRGCLRAYRARRGGRMGLALTLPKLVVPSAKVCWRASVCRVQQTFTPAGSE